MMLTLRLHAISCECTLIIYHHWYPVFLKIFFILSVLFSDCVKFMDGVSGKSILFPNVPFTARPGDEPIVTLDLSNSKLAAEI